MDNIYIYNAHMEMVGNGLNTVHNSRTCLNLSFATSPLLPNRSLPLPPLASRLSRLSRPTTGLSSAAHRSRTMCWSCGRCLTFLCRGFSVRRGSLTMRTASPFARLRMPRRQPRRKRRAHSQRNSCIGKCCRFCCGASKKMCCMTCRQRLSR